jgi:hypothetical protein
MPLATTHGGAVLASPRFVPIVFSAEARTSDIATFMKNIAGSTYWGLAAQYGVGPATASDPIVIDETPPAGLMDDDIQAWLATKITTPDPNAIYVIYYPAATTIMSWGPSCLAFWGYHSETKIAGVKTVYAVIADCGEPFGPVTSHELFEAATDPYYFTNKAWEGVDDTYELYSMNDELGDLCEEANDNVTPSDIGYPVQRMWSNAAAAAGQDPCQPEPAPYFRTVTNVEQISLAPGASTTVDLVAFSDGDTGGPWTIKVTSSYNDLADKLDLQLCRASVQNGEHIPLVIQRDAWSTNGSSVQIESNLGNVTTTWRFDVGN